MVVASEHTTKVGSRWVTRADRCLIDDIIGSEE